MGCTLIYDLKLQFIFINFSVYSLDYYSMSLFLLYSIKCNNNIPYHCQQYNPLHSSIRCTPLNQIASTHSPEVLKEVCVCVYVFIGL